MVKLVSVTKAGGEMLDDENDVRVSVNADNINICKPVHEDQVGKTKIVFNDGTTINVVET
ncbi:conserved hypothetical protein [Candidatus Nitrotoga sp. BS]|uniref:hypothetical protein n=1 Tax=Candidatus Nitrotoga sp. BS TaxID=2890408 RepID=UPI001EF389B6|nr:hypothetical protein [Candidatus Nitrotoga sp. BS]CAH1201355.1 conserved hypothetical protein [Candidatus Nitrotoga sp. BS]